MAITGGYVTLGRTANLGDYNSKKVEVQIGFDSPDNLVEATNIARATIEALLNGKDVAAADTAKAAHAAAAEAKEPKALKEPKKKAEKAAEVKPAATPAADPTSLVADTPQISTGGERVDPTSLDDEFAAEPSPVTDADLNKAAQKKAEALNATMGDEGRKAIRVLIGKFVAAPKKMTDIPPEARAEFLKQLEALAP